jgi:hypothetical protein
MINIGLTETLKLCLLAAEVNRPFKSLSVAAIGIRLAKHSSEGVLFPSILLFIFLPACYLLFSSTEPGHVSPPVPLVSTPPRILLHLERESGRQHRVANF